jgi:sugar/nucleoside kinase (ribokinase family)
MKIVVIGHICFDMHHYEDGTELRHLGGIFNSVAAMASAAGENDTIIPIFGVGHNEYHDVLSALKKFSNIDTSGIFVVEGKTNHIHFWYNNGNETDCSQDIAAPIPFDAILPFLKKIDAVYINLQSGFDILLDTLDHIRLEIRGKKIPLYLDMHNITRGVNPDGTRFRRPMSDWRRWCFMTDFVQMNEEEAAGISIEKFSDELLAKQMMPLMVNAFFITRGTKGISLYQDVHKHLITKEIAVSAVDEPASTVGSGDIFGSLCIYFYLKLKNIVEAAEKASAIAAVSTKYSGAEKFERIKEIAA